jgi:hypothetical protein
VLDKTVKTSQDLSRSEEMKLLSFPDKNSDVFTWKTSDLTGVSRSIIAHKLQGQSFGKAKGTKLCKMPDEKVVVAKFEVQRLLDAGFIREIQYLS